MSESDKAKANETLQQTSENLKKKLKERMQSTPLADVLPFAAFKCW